MAVAAGLRRHRGPLLAAGLFAGGVLLWHADPATPGGLLPPCPFYWLTGLYCPGCGTTRALHALLHLDVAQALTMNPLLVLALPLIALVFLRALDLLPAALHDLARRVGDARPWAAVVITYAVLRNLPWEPFAWLAPGA